MIRKKSLGLFRVTDVLSENILAHRCQFHQHFTSSFFVQKFCLQLFSTCILGLYFPDARILVQKLIIKCWWNWTPGWIRNNYWYLIILIFINSMLNETYWVRGLLINDDPILREGGCQWICDDSNRALVIKNLTMRVEGEVMKKFLEGIYGRSLVANLCILDHINIYFM